MIFVWLLNPISGPVSAVAKALGVTIPIWSNTQGLVIVVLSIITSWKIFGYNFIVVMAGVSSVPLEVVEAARLDDVPNWRIFLEHRCPHEQLHRHLCADFVHRHRYAADLHPHQHGHAGRPPTTPAPTSSTPSTIRRSAFSRPAPLPPMQS